MKRPRGILFDFGDTLIEQVSFDYDAGEQRLLELAVQPHSISLEQVNTRKQEIDKIIWPGRDETCLEFSIQAFQRLLFEPLGLRFTHSALDLEIEFLKSAAVMKPEPEVKPVLDYLAGENIRMGIVSNTIFSSAALCSMLQQFQIESYFQFVMASADYGIRKPHPLFMQVAVQKIGLPPESLWMVGDLKAYDIAGAKNAGMTGVWYHRRDIEQEGPEPDLEVKNWLEFQQIIEQLS